MLVNVIILLIIGLFTVVGFKKGVIQQAVMFAGTILVYIIAFFLKNPIANIFFRFFPFLNFWGELEGLVVLNVIVYQLLAFVIVSGILFGVFGIVLKVTGLLQKAVNMTVILTLPSKVMGGIIGFLEGYVMVFLVLTIFAIPLAPLGITDSTLAQTIMYKSPILSKSLGGINETIQDIFTLVGDGYDRDVSKNQMNLEVMDTMLKYNVISTESVDILLDNNKLNGVSGISDIVNKYRGDE